ncbi:phosphotransferase KptA/Tpt1 [Scheffersomyces xylosifermentans]|uniref:phosphotransferase KptA/Tpt1 n=1 Tax=Scheffersomyces xylosifermentans TaxID=1304137 RepID=UPI00315C5AFA
MTEADQREVKISKALSYLLRHGALKEKLDIDEEGYVKISALLQHQRLKSYRTTREDIDAVVRNNNKKRFTIRDGEYICANQGHSIKKVSNNNLDLMTLETIPKEVYHGTYKKKLPSIIASGGLSRMNRNHIHMTSREFSKISGIRYNADILVYIDVAKSMAAGIKFYKSLNNVILSEGDENGFISWKYYEKIVDIKTGNELAIEQFFQENQDKNSTT